MFLPHCLHYQELHHLGSLARAWCRHDGKFVKLVKVTAARFILQTTSLTNSVRFERGEGVGNIVRLTG